MRSKAWKRPVLLSVVVLMLAITSACGSATPTAKLEHDVAGPGLSGASPFEPASLGAGEKLQVVATTNIVGDVVKNVGGDRIDLTTLMGIGVDPHSYVPTPSDTAAVHDAHLVFANGAGLESDLEEMLETAGGEAAVVYLSDGLELHPPEGQEGSHQESDHEHGGVDPHVWFSVPNVIHWVETIESTLSMLDPNNAGTYGENADAYIHELAELDAWVQQLVDQIPEENRKLVTNHPSFGYFADRYGLEQLGAVYPVNPSSEPSAQDIAALEDAIGELGVPAVFTENTVNAQLAEQVAQDTGIKLVPLYTGSLGKAGSGAETYILLIRSDTSAMVEALR